jgi:hypothetical protein
MTRAFDALDLVQTTTLSTSIGGLDEASTARWCELVWWQGNGETG